MSSFGDKAKQIISTVAPLLGGALGGPLGAAAGSFIAKQLGGGDTKAAEQAILSGDPQTLLALKQAEDAFRSHLADLGVEEEKIAADDRANARAREVALKDYTPAILAFAVTLGFFGVLGWMLNKGIPANAGGEALLVMLGSLGTAWAGIVAYYFGSSAGSASKSDALNKIASAK
jgi:hypothetical protein